MSSPVDGDPPRSTPAGVPPGRQRDELGRAKYLADRSRRRLGEVSPGWALDKTRRGQPGSSSVGSRRSGWLLLTGLLALAIVAAVVALLPGDGAPPQQAGPEVQPPIVDETGQSLPTSFAPVSPPPRTSSRPAAPSATVSRPRPAPPPRPVPRPTVSRSRIVLPPTSYEAESGVNRLRYGARVDGHPAASHGLMVYAIGADNLGTLEFRGLSIPATDRYVVKIFYQNPDDTVRTAYASVNGGPDLVLRFGPTGSCCIETRTMLIRLVAGTNNTILFGNPYERAPDIDRIEISGPIA